MSERQFHLGAILSITHDRLIAPNHMDDIYDICNFLTGDNLFTHQLPRVHAECKAWLLTLHPTLAAIPMVSDAAALRRGEKWWIAWLAEQIAIYGETLPVTPIPAGIHEFKDPILEAVEMVGKDRVLVIDTNKEKQK